MIVQELHRIQARLGYLPRSQLEALADRLRLPLYRLQEVVSFFPHFRTKPPVRIEVQVCRDMACQLRGSEEIHGALNELTSQTPSTEVRVDYASCLGRCDRAPAVRLSVNEPQAASNHGHAVHMILGRSPSDTCEVVRAAIGGTGADRIPHDSDTHFTAVDPERWLINIYAGRPKSERYESIRRFVASYRDGDQRGAESDRIIRALETAGLLGMGGAGGRTFKKWSEVREAVGDKKYVVCNADESEPGTFKDRELLLRTPYLVLEGVILAGLLLRATRGYLYVRHEYEEQIEALRAEIESARSMHVCGEEILGTDLSFPVEVFVSPGGYICGEQTALIEAIEDNRAEPRNRPPELQTNGLWNMPTLLNNVETLAWVPSIVLRDDGAWYARQGADKPAAISRDEADAKFKGARFFSVSGDVLRPGVYEVPIGIKLGDLIKAAGGMRRGSDGKEQELKAVALSGPSGGFTPAVFPLELLPPALIDRVPAGATALSILDLELDIGLFRKWNLMLGAGIVVYGQDADLVAQAQTCLEFYRQESCGKCVPCRIGSTKLAEIATDLRARRLDTASIAALKREDGKVVELADIMQRTAICGLGTVAANPLTTLLTYFDKEVRRYP